jgi:hypothetical protein
MPSAPAASVASISPRLLPRRSASSPARHRDNAPVTPKSSSAVVATAPSGRSIGRKVTRPPPARVTTNRTTEGATAARTAARRVRVGALSSCGPSDRTSRGTKSTPSSGDAASHASHPTCPSSTSATPAGTAIRLGTAMASP